ncbi:unnamed protein product [Prorocentrum cordatum]|uniref:Uncharacterized protein n=1 Tax=Prorocentrum cordatum TaxID=2364126 RepID=A0ABN9W8T1_9DINO|nr:unnamed protein product [Polarella glacialis]
MVFLLERLRPTRCTSNATYPRGRRLCGDVCCPGRAEDNCRLLLAASKAAFWSLRALSAGSATALMHRPAQARPNRGGWSGRRDSRHEEGWHGEADKGRE